MLTFNPEPYPLGEAILLWCVVVAACSLLVFLLAILIGAIVGGRQGVGSIFRGIGEAGRDLIFLSPGRVVAMTQLTFREALRRKALLVFVIFALLFMFAGWFMNSVEQRPAEYVEMLVSFVLTSLSFLILPVALLLACWGVPEDIKRRSLHTVVTKPVRRSEIIIGRILGYVGINTIVLLVMGIVGFVWIYRQVYNSDTPLAQEAQAALVSRVPLYGSLSFLDKDGQPAQKGINVGDVWAHRSYIAGNTEARAIYVFDSITPAAMTPITIVENGEEQPAQRLRLESTFEAFRTFKGDMKRGLFVQYTYVNPAHPERRYLDDAVFEINEFKGHIQLIPQKLPINDPGKFPAKFVEAGPEGNPVIDLFEYLVGPQGKLRVEVAGIDGGQYIGMANADLFVRLPDHAFASGYFKAVFGIWLMTVLIVVIGVTASTFLKGPVATILTLVLFIVGSPLRDFMDELAVRYQQSLFASGELRGGGPLESIVRIIQHKNLTTELADNMATDVIEAIDHVFLSGIWIVRYLIPDFSVYKLTEVVSKGFDVGFWTGLLPAISVTLAFVIPCLVIGYFSLRFRELESK